MTETEKRRVILIVGGTTGFFILVVAIVLVFDFRSLVQSRLSVTADEMNFVEDGFVADEFVLPDDVIIRGSIKRDQTVEGTIGTWRSEGWSFTGDKGEVYLLDFEPIAGGYTWTMTVYGPDRQMVAFTTDSDAGYADFTQLEVILQDDGTYAVVLTAFGEDGTYSLSIR